MSCHGRPGDRLTPGLRVHRVAGGCLGDGEVTAQVFSMTSKPGISMAGEKAPWQRGLWVGPRGVGHIFDSAQGHLSRVMGHSCVSARPPWWQGEEEEGRGKTESRTGRKGPDSGQHPHSLRVGKAGCALGRQGSAQPRTISEAETPRTQLGLAGQSRMGRTRP